MNATESPASESVLDEFPEGPEPGYQQTTGLKRPTEWVVGPTFSVPTVIALLDAGVPWYGALLGATLAVVLPHVVSFGVDVLRETDAGSV